MAPRKEARKSARPQAVVRTRRPTGGEVRTIAVRFPVAYLHIIEAEGARIDVSRGQFLTMLVKRQEGVIMLERPPAAPTYTLIAKELEETKLYMWQVAPEVRERIDAERLRLGNIAVAAYLLGREGARWPGHPGSVSPFPPSKPDVRVTTHPAFHKRSTVV
jgi:hypothetical protein